MTQSDLKTLIDQGADAGTIWAAVQNHVAQQIDAAKQEAFDAHAKNLADANAAKDAAEKALADYKAQVTAVASAISAAVNDPKTDTDSAVTAILHEATKDDRAKQTDALDAQIAELQAKRDSLK